MATESKTATMTGMKEITITDSMRLNISKVTIRFNPNDVIRLPCSCDYDKELKGKVDLLRKVEVKSPSGIWGPYPSVALIDGIDATTRQEQKFTRAIIRKSVDKEIAIMKSPNNALDITLYNAAENARVNVFSIDY